jgi:hypothetical protein
MYLQYDVSEYIRNEQISSNPHNGLAPSSKVLGLILALHKRWNV